MREAGRITIVLLAGGLATRLPGKLTLPVGGEPMLVRVYRRLTSRDRPCIVSSRAPLEAALASSIAAPVVVDDFEDAGPLGGLVSAAARVQTPLFFAAAGDLPNIDARFVDELEREFDRLAASGNAPEAVVPAWPDGMLEPLAALYDAAAFARAGRRALDAGRRRVTAVLDDMRVVRYAIGPEDEARLANVNTPDDYAAHGR
jgi:molybdopterin-guanine dinucleotide biosynthesis protein A